jgi:Holliday junction resolvase
MAPERKFYQKIKKYFSDFSLIRLENSSLHGTPDLLVCNASGYFFTIELKVTKSNKVKFSPHQIAFHVKHPHNTFICIEHLGSGAVKLFHGSQILELETRGLELEACCLGLEACHLFFSKLGA